MDRSSMGSAKYCLLFVQIWAKEQDRQNRVYLNICCIGCHPTYENVHLLWSGECGYNSNIYDESLSIHQFLLQLSRWRINLTKLIYY